MQTTTNPQIKEGVIRDVLQDFYACQIMHRTSFMVKDSLNPISSYKGITIEELCSYYGVTEEMQANLLYAIEIRRRLSHQFDEIAKKVLVPKSKQYINDIDSMSVNALTELFLTGEVHEIVRKFFPTLPVYKIPGEKQRTTKHFLLLFPYWYNNDYDFAVLDYLRKAGFAGSLVIRLPMAEVSKLLYVLVNHNKIDAIINFYDHGASCCDWDWNKDALMNNLKNQPGIDKNGLNYFISLLEKIPKNYGNNGNGGFVDSEVQQLLVNI